MNKVQKLFMGGLMACVAASSMAQTFVGERTDFRDETIYFAMTTRFYDGDPTNNVCGWDHQDVQIENNDPDWRGDFKGLIDKLDYIKALGFTAIWITPIVQNCSGTDFHGYHAMDFSTVDLRYESRTKWGASQDVKFQDLIDAAHAKGMKVVLDIVLNHTGNFGEKHFAPLFSRSQDIRNQASVSASIIPNYDLLPSNYNDLPGKEQYNARFPYLKNTDGTNKDSHNYWHHVGTGWNWDYPNRWWVRLQATAWTSTPKTPPSANIWWSSTANSSPWASTASASIPRATSRALPSTRPLFRSFSLWASSISRNASTALPSSCSANAAPDSAM